MEFDQFDIFISYSRKNLRWVNKLITDLKKHDIRVWIDTLEINVGDIFRQKIEEGISKSKYFCLIISPHSMKSYYVRQLEIETAFNIMAQQKKDTFILPVIVKMPTEKLPPMLSQYNYLDFSETKQYNNNLTKLIQRIKLDKTNFTGIKYYKNVDVSPLGFVFGVGEIDHISPTGFCVRFHYDNGFPVRLDLLKDQKIDHYKLVYFKNEKVIKKEIYNENRLTGKLIYYYNRNGIRNRKQIFGTGKYPISEIEYDLSNRRIREKYFNGEGKLDDSNGFAIKEYLYDKSGKKVGEKLFDSDGKILEQ